MPHLFGYGSLLSPPSVSRTLGREVTLADLRPCTVDGYRRTWTAPVTVYMDDDGRGVRALFLDLTPSPATACAGVLLAVSDAELPLMDARERGYERRAVTALVGGVATAAIAYVIPDREKSTEGRVLRNYVQLIERALSAYPPDLVAAFRRATDPAPEPLVDGGYRFTADPPTA